MCSTCGGDYYGQSQDEARRLDAEKLKRVRKVMEAKSLAKLNK